MTDDPAIARYRNAYRKLLRLYPRPYRERFGESMEQTFQDLCRERARKGEGLAGIVFWLFVETSAAIIRENARSIIMLSLTRRLVGWAALVGLVLLVPLVARAPWTGFDFVCAGTLLFGAALVYELVARQGGTIAYRVAVGVAVATALVLTWVNAAVGIIGDGPVNLMYFGVIAVGLIGALLARLRPRGMAWTLLAMAVAQMLVPTIALVVWNPPFDPGVVPVFVLNGGFALLFGIAALLFRHAGTQGSQPGKEGARSAQIA